MNLNMIKVVISREYTTRVKKKSFLVITFLVPVLFAAMCCIPALLMIFNKDEVKTLAVIDRSGIVLPQLKDNAEVTYVDCCRYELDSLKLDFAESPYSGILYISAIDSTKSLTVSTYSEKPIGLSLQENIKKTVEQTVQDYRIAQYGIDNLKTILDEVKPDIDIKTYVLDEEGQEKISDDNVYRVLSFVLGIIIFMFVTLFSSSVMQSVIEEKQSKVVEVLLSSVDAMDLMFGKIIGVALVALTQFLLWIFCTAVIVGAVFGAIGKDKLMGAASSEVVAVADPSALAGGMDPSAASFDAAAMLGSAPAATADTAAAAPAAEPNGLQTVVSTLANLDLSLIIGCFLIFFVFGYLLYASLFAAIGSAVENAEDSNQLQVPLTIPLMLGYFIALYAWNAPDSAIAFWGSMIPFTSPIVMLARIPFGVPAWEIWLSVALLILTFVFMGWLSAKIYRVGILTSGKKATYKDLWRWLKQK